MNQVGGIHLNNNLLTFFTRSKLTRIYHWSQFQDPAETPFRSSYRYASLIEKVILINVPAQGPSAHASYTTIANPNSTAAPNAPSPRHPSQGPLNQWPGTHCSLNQLCMPIFSPQGMSSYGSHNTPDPNVTTASSVHRSTKVHNRGLSPYGPYNTNHNFKAASSTSSTRYPSGSSMSSQSIC